MAGPDFGQGMSRASFYQEDDDQEIIAEPHDQVGALIDQLAEMEKIPRNRSSLLLKFRKRFLRV